MSSEPGSITVVMADDDPDDRLMAKRAFERAHVPNVLLFVEDGEELMDYLYRRERYAPPADAPRPGLVLLDLNMPRKDGWEVLREMKADASLRQIRVVILTTSRSKYDKHKAYDVSATSYITKPATFAGFVEVAQALGKYWLDVVDMPDVEEGARE